MNDLVTIIVPVFNAERYLTKCIESIIHQKYKNIELIMINDGSTDESLKIMKQFAEKDSRIVIIDEKNKGVSHARNIGMDAAQGEYIMFVDADDYIDEKTVERLIYKAKSNNVDIVRFNGYIEDRNSKYNPLGMINDGEILNSCEHEKEIIEIFNSPDRSIQCYSPFLFLKNTNLKKFNERLSYLEDKLFYLENLLNNKKTLFLNERLYYYRFNDQSKTKNISMFGQNIDNILEAHIEIVSFIKKIDSIYENLMKNSTMVLILYRIEYLAENTRYSDFKKYITDCLKNTELKQLLNTKIETRKRLKRIQFYLLKNNYYFLLFSISKTKKILRRLIINENQ